MRDLIGAINSMEKTIHGCFTHALADCPPDCWSSMDEPPYEFSSVSLCHCNGLSTIFQMV